MFLKRVNFETRLRDLSCPLGLRLKESKSLLNVPQGFLEDIRHLFIDLPPCGDGPFRGSNDIRRCWGRRVVHLRQLLVVRN